MEIRNNFFNLVSKKYSSRYFRCTNTGIFISVLLLLISPFTNAEEDVTFSNSLSNDNVELAFHQIEGKVTPPEPKPSDWYWATRILIDGGKKLAFLKVNVLPKSCKILL